ncbi:MAG: thiolase family protein [Hyphomicrobiaceae bacterium]
MTSSQPPAYLVAARRTAIGRIGGIHRNRRVEDLATALVAPLLADARLGPGDIDEVVLGNAAAGSNPARLVALSAGLADTVPAITLDQQCASGLAAILQAFRTIAAGEASIVLAGGAESLSTAPWRVARPRTAGQLPRFLGFGATNAAEADAPILVEAAEALAQKFQITRPRQDDYAAESRERAGREAAERSLRDEIVSLKVAASEVRDEALTASHGLGDLADLPTFFEPDGTVTPGNSTAMHDGAALALVVDAAVWEGLGRPPAIRLLASATTGTPPGAEAEAPIAAVARLKSRLNGSAALVGGLVELGETSAAQAIAFADSLGIDAAHINPHGGGLTRGHPYGAAGAVLAVRMFSHLARHRRPDTPSHGTVVLGAIGGLGTAALFEAV